MVASRENLDLENLNTTTLKPAENARALVDDVTNHPEPRQWEFVATRSYRYILKYRAIERRRGSGFFYRPSTDTGKPRTPGYRGTRVPVLPFPAIVLSQRLAHYRSTRYAATRQLRSSVLTARANQLHRMPLICAVAADQHVLNMAK
jgi:hypothetical protein